MKRKERKTFFLIMVCAVLAVALGGCSGDKEGDDSSQIQSTVDSVITVGISQDIEDSLDPHKAVAAGTREVLFNLFEGLVKPSPDGNHIPAIASSYTISEDSKIYTFVLREGVKFHDGSVVTAEDVKFSIEKCADTGSGPPLVPAYSNIDRVTIKDAATVEISLKEADTEFLPYMTTAILPAGNGLPETNPIGTGPYRYVSRSPQENIILEKFDEYWGEPANIEKVIFKICTNMDTLVMELESGSIDMFAHIPAPQASELSGQYQVMEGTMNLVQALYLNHQEAPFDDERVRQALCYAVDPQEIMMMVSDGRGIEVGSSMFPSFTRYYVEELKDTYIQDQEQARRLLAEAGYPEGFSFTMTVPSNYPQHVDTAQVLAEQLKAIGVEVSIELVEWESWLSDVYAGRQYQATVIGLDATSLTAAAMLERFTSEAPNNFISFRNEEYDRVYAEAKANSDEGEKTALYKECLRILAERAANVYIQDLPDFVALNIKFGGYEFYPLYVQDIARLYVVGN